MTVVTDHLVPAATAGAVALLVTPWVARLGLWGIRQWLEQDIMAQLRRVELIWKISSIVLAIAMTLGPLPGMHITEASGAIAAGMIGLAAALLIQLARIDSRCRLLPDPLTLSLLASGLLFNALFMPSRLIDGFFGAVFGYGLLWGLATLFEKLRHVQAMGRGDFAMAAGIGAWLGWQALPFALVFSCIFAFVFTALRYLAHDASLGPRGAFLSQELAFGPALAAGAVLAWISLG